MDQRSKDQSGRSRPPRWIALGFLAAFATSVFTVIYTGLEHEGERGVFDTGFRSVTMVPGERRTVELVFDSDAAYTGATLALILPAVAELGAAPEYQDGSRFIDLVAGENRLDVEIRALAEGSGYLTARIEAREPIAIDRVFVTVTAE